MAERIFIGGAPTAAQVNTETPDGSPATNDIYYVRLDDRSGNSHEISFTCGATQTTAAVVTGLQAAAAAADSAGTAPWNAVTTTDDTTHMTITGDTAGQPFRATATATGGGSPTLTDANTTACAGPSIFSTAENWVAETAAVADDTVKIRADVTTAIYGEDFSAVNLDNFEIEEGCTAEIGSRAWPLQLVLSDNTNYFYATLGGTGETHLEITDYQHIYVNNAGAAPATGRWSMNLTGTHDDGTAGRGEIYVNCGSTGTVGIGANAGEDMEVNKIIVGGTPANLTVGSAVTENDDSTAPDMDMSGGVAKTFCPLGIVTKTGGTLYHEEGVVGTLNEDGGTTYYKADDTATTVNIGQLGTVDCTLDLRARTFTNINMYGGATLIDPFKTIADTNGIDLVRCGLTTNRVNIDRGVHETITLSAI